MMDYAGNELVCFDKKLLDCLEKGNNDEAKSISKLVILQNAKNFRNLKDNTGSTLLHYSVKYNNAEMIQYFIEMGSNIDAVDNFGFTPLMLAIENANVVTTKILLDNNASIFTKNSTLKLSFQQTIKSIPGEKRHQQILEMILAEIHKADLSEIEDDLEKFAVVVFGHEKLAEEILKNDYDIDFQEPTHGLTALHCAIIFCKHNRAIWLIDHGADMTIVNNLGFLPLRYYTWGLESIDIKSAVLNLLLKGNTEFYLPNEWGFNEVEYLLKYGRKRTVHVALRIGLKIVASEIASYGRYGVSRSKDIEKITELLCQTGLLNKILKRNSFARGLIYNFNIFSFKPVIADLALMSVALKKSPQTDFGVSADEMEKVSVYFSLCSEQVKEMKSIKVHGTVTLFMLLTHRKDQLAAYARNEDLILSFNELMKRTTGLEPYYFNTLQKRVSNAIERAEFEARVALIIEILTGFCTDVHHVIVYQIISYLELKDLHNLCRAKII